MLTIAGLPRGIPAASLKHRGLLLERHVDAGSSAGNTRGLIEAIGRPFLLRACTTRLPRGIPAASLKLAPLLHFVEPAEEVFRGEYPRPH